MLELISSAPFLIIAFILVSVFLIIGIVKRAVRFLIWSSVILAILIIFGIGKQSDIRNWFENFFKITG